MKFIKIRDEKAPDLTFFYEKGLNKVQMFSRSSHEMENQDF